MVVSRADLEATISRLESEVEDPRAGIYGPTSQSWKISKEAILFLGGGRAALLQTAHPYVAHGVDQHSATKSDPLGRFQRTFDNVFAMVFGDLDSAIKSARRVHNIHTKISGLIQENVGRFPEGAQYLANDEDALFWVHATLIDTAVQVYELVLRPLSYEEKDRYYRETRRFAYLFGIPDSVMPRDWGEFADYNQAMWNSDTLKVGKPALELRRFLFAAPKPAYGPFFRWLETMTAGLMPARLRDEYQLPWSPADQRWFRASVSALKLSYPRMPARLRYLPAYVEARRRLAGKTGPDRVGQFLERLVMVPLRRAPAKRRPRRTANA